MTNIHILYIKLIQYMNTICLTPQRRVNQMFSRFIAFLADYIYYSRVSLHSRRIIYTILTFHCILGGSYILFSRFTAFSADHIYHSRVSLHSQRIIYTILAFHCILGGSYILFSRFTAFSANHIYYSRVSLHSRVII